jgi:hypothetical protein
MTWTTFHRRAEVLREVIALVDARGDGLLPPDLPGVRETFGDELGLLGALQLRWHTRLAGQVETFLDRESHDPEGAVVSAWRATARELPGVRAVLDRCREHPLDERMADATVRAAAKEHAFLAAAAGLAGPAAGSGIEQRARAGLSHVAA